MKKLTKQKGFDIIRLQIKQQLKQLKKEKQMNIDVEHRSKAEQILIDNGIEEDEAKTVLQALGYALLDQEIYPTLYRARCIQWDRTDDDGEHIEIDLPSEVTVELDDLQLPDNATDEEIEDAMAEYLSDYYGFCHNGFVFEKVETWN